MNEGLYIMDRIRSRCHEDGDCLVWDGRVDIAGAPYLRAIRVRRHVWQLQNGKPVPKGKIVVPGCGLKRCLEHLELSTKAEVMAQAMSRPDVVARKKLASKVIQRSRGKLSEAKVQAIRSSDKTQRALAQEHGVSQSLISRVVTGQSWQDSRPNPFAGLMA